MQPDDHAVRHGRIVVLGHVGPGLVLELGHAERDPPDLVLLLLAGLRRGPRRRQGLRRQVLGQGGHLEVHFPRLVLVADLQLEAHAGLEGGNRRPQLLGIFHFIAGGASNHVAGFDLGPGRRAAGIDVTHGDARVVAAAEGQDAQKAELERFQLRAQFQVGLDPLVAAEDDEMHLVAGVVTADFLLDLGRAGHLAAADLDDPVAALELGLGGRRVRAAGSDHGVARIEVLRLHEDPRHAGVEVLALAELGEHLLDGLQGHSEADARVVPFDAGDFLGRLRRERHDQAHHAAADIDQRTAVVVGRSGGVGLQGLAPHPAHGA